MAGPSSMVESDNDWQAESDARTLIDAEKIEGDPKRKEKAMKALVKMKKDKQDELDAMACLEKENC